MTYPMPNTEEDSELRPIPMVNGLDCPACGHPTLILGDGGYITCSLEGCPNPDYAEALDAYQHRQTVEARLDESRNNYSSVIKVIQDHADNPDFMWCEITAPIAARLAQLNKEHAEESHE